MATHPDAGPDDEDADQRRRSALHDSELGSRHSRELANDPDERDPVLVLTEFAERLDDLANTADLMGDEPTATRWRANANEVRLRAMSNFDD